ncbi:hypothetical protein GCM10007973_06710 [Polymorphobacter multimanifer]|uniref:Lipoprotein n=2 Tax=Polymorphobacter multimanifer TaxID=1070431 RepID=A0A841L3C4_9SPHN|nr:hypothetical protein [Polymorphobacter multimanifer]MBB6227167.1 hypothetical protein [Polymorphobacter multimanifer]GGI72344.1 hypothetical protein GCM10007973_06710 [Polymorphobacter multimanifer]
MRAVLLVGALALAGCAGGSGGMAWGSGGAPAGERAVLGIDETDIIDLIIECAPARRGVRFVMPVGETAKPGQIELGIGDARFVGRETMEGEYESLQSVTTVPPGHLLLARIAAGAPRLSIRYNGKRSRVKLGPVPQQAVQRCLAGI